MQKIVILSDTHGNQRFLRQVLQRETPYSHLFHLGDFYDDLASNPDLTDGVEVVQVPGIFHAGYLDGSLPAVVHTQVAGWHFTLVHAIQDVKAVPRPCDIICFGHTHKCHFSQEDGYWLLNPGHLKELIHRNQTAAYCIIEVNDSEAVITFRGLDGQAMHQHAIHKNREEA